MSIPIAHCTTGSDDSLPVAHDAQFAEPTVPPPPVPASPSAPPIDCNQAESKDYEFECPVCFDSIHPASATMRCDGSGGQPHFFHAHCLGTWIQSCQEQGNTATCPCCRGGVQVHTQRLSEFLETSSHTTENNENITVGRRILRHFGSVRDGWVKVPALSDLTREDVIEGATIVAGVGIGFYAGVNGSNLSTGNWAMDAELWERSSMATKVGTVVGYTAGCLYNWWSSSTDRNEEDEEERRRRR